MEIYKKYSISHIDSILVKKYNAIEIEGYELLNSINYSEEVINDIIKTYKIEDENIINSILSEKEKEELKITTEYLEKNEKYDNESIIFSDMQKIVTGKLIVLMLESEDNKYLSGFIMHGSGEKLYNLLTDFVSDNVERNSNKLEEAIEEMKRYSPYGTFFK